MPLTGPYSLLHDGQMRTYWLHLPEIHPARLPVWIVLHGAGGTAEWAADETLLGPLADREGFAIVYPEGLALDPLKKPKFLTNPQVWNDGSGRNPQIDDVGFLQSLAERLLNDPRFDPARLYVTGFSNGAGMTFRVAAEGRFPLAAIAPVAGHVWIDPPRRDPLPTLYLIGELDPLIPLHGGVARTPWGMREGRPKVAESLSRWATAMNLPRLEHVADIPSGILQVRLIPGLGHHWPGGQGKMGEKLGGPIVDHFSANRAIADFFNQLANRDASQSP